MHGPKRRKEKLGGKSKRTTPQSVFGQTGTLVSNGAFAFLATKARKSTELPLSCLSVRRPSALGSRRFSASAKLFLELQSRSALDCDAKPSGTEAQSQAKVAEAPP